MSRWKQPPARPGGAEPELSRPDARAGRKRIARRWQFPRGRRRDPDRFGAAAGCLGGSDGGEDWGGLYGLLATACGYHPRDIDELTLFDIDDLCGYWADHPPTHVLVAAFLGVKPRPAPAASAMRVGEIGAPGDVGQLMASLGDGDPYQGCKGPAVYDFTALKARQQSSGR
jgi:hypothetical protein